MKTIIIKGTGLTGKQWITRLENGGYHISSWAEEIILSPEFDKQRLKKGEEQTITFIKHSDVGNSPTTKEIQEYAKTKGCQMPSPELALLIREQVSDEEMKAMSIWYIVSLHDPIKDSVGSPFVLSADRRGDGRWVSAFWDSPDRRWSTDGASAFPVSASSTQKLDTEHSDTLSLEAAIQQEAVSAAIEGGWEPPFYGFKWWMVGGMVLWNDGQESFHWQQIALDPSFWQALGKALGWNDDVAFETYTAPMWKMQAMRFIDLIITGGSTDQFWDELLAN